MSNWKPAPSSADGEISRSILTLRDRCRDLVRNDAYAERGVSVIVNSTVGTGILAKIVDNPKVQEAFNQWAKSPDMVDITGELDFYALQAQVLRCVVESGECLVVRKRNPLSPLSMLVLEGDYLDSSKGVNGIEYEPSGRKKAYWLFDKNPNDEQSQARKVPAKDVIHVFRKDRPQQTRGVPWLAPVITRLRDLGSFEHAELQRRIIATAFAAFVSESPDQIDDTTYEIDEKITAGTIYRIPPGADIKFSNPPSPAGYPEYVRSQIMRISSALGITYEALSNDFAGANFSSARLAHLQMQRYVDSWQWHILVPQLCDKIYKWFAEANGINLEKVKVEWVPPRRELIDPKAETEAQILRIQAGLASISQTIRESGDDPDFIIEDRKNDKKFNAELALQSQGGGKKDAATKQDK